MVLARLRRALGLVLIVTFFVLAAGPLFGDSAKGEVVDRQLRSENIAHNKIGSDPVRKMAIYLPLGYDDAAMTNVRYPVIYFLPTPEASYRAAFDHEVAQHLFDRAVRSPIIDKSLRGFKLDWERNDGNPDHVYANQAFTRELEEFGIPHEAEEYSSVWGHGVWAEDGRIYAEVLPFSAGTWPLSSSSQRTSTRGDRRASQSRCRSVFSPSLYGSRQCFSNPHCAGTYDPCADNGQPGDAKAQHGGLAGKYRDGYENQRAMEGLD